MNWDQIEGKWTEMKGKARSNWGDLTDDELDPVSYTHLTLPTICSV